MRRNFAGPGIMTGGRYGIAFDTFIAGESGGEGRGEEGDRPCGPP